MKKAVLILLGFAGFAAANAQVTFGPKAGLNVSSITGKDVEGYKSKTGFYIGAQGMIPVKANFAVQPELYYSAQGAKWTGYEGKGGQSKLSYINLPVLAKYSTRHGFFAETGPQVGLLLSAIDDYVYIEDDDFKDKAKKIDFAWVVGAGYLSKYGVGINARYNIGLTKFWDEEKNAVFQIGLFYNLNRHFGMGGK
ncbi:MAG: PorT family protein [Chitinophagaceae bacterium]|nr:PorT family protein [Chitinophagaceae bacterium]